MQIIVCVTAARSHARSVLAIGSTVSTMASPGRTTLCGDCLRTSGLLLYVLA